jgi:hypothetical protein
MELTAEVRLAVYRHFAETGGRPDAAMLAAALGARVEEVRGAFGRLRAERLLFLEPDGETIRMAPPFSGVPTQHRVEVEGREYFANCAWDALGIPAAFQRAGMVRSRCAQTREPLQLEVGSEGPGPSSWVFHSLVPAARWWDDLVFT